MKKTITLLALAFTFTSLQAQEAVADFENLVLGTDTFFEKHKDTTFQNNGASFRYFWDSQYSIWDAGFAYTNKNNTTNHTYTNLYGAVTGKGYNNSAKYVTASQGYLGQKMNITLSAPQQTVAGFYVTNTTFGYNTMLHGGGPARAFGDTLNTHSGMQPGNYPDWFRLSIYGYKNGVKKADTVAFYLADYRFTNNTQDYIVNNWRWVDCTSLGSVDSICMKLFSSDVGQFGINNPTYFCIDNFTTWGPTFVGVAENAANLELNAYPNPFHSSLTVSLKNDAPATAVIKDLSGRTIHSETITQKETTLHIDVLQTGVYFLELTTGDKKTVKKIVKN